MPRELHTESDMPEYACKHWLLGGGESDMGIPIL